MQRHHSGYDNIVTWKTVRTGDSLVVVPAPGLAWWNAVVCVPFFAVALWFLHFQLEIATRAGLLLADAIIVGTQGLLFVLCWRARSRAKADCRPCVEVSRSQRMVRFPRADVELPLSSGGYFVAHDFFTDGCEFAVSELNFVRESAGEEQSVPLLHAVGRFTGFDRIGRELAEWGVPFQFRRQRV